MRNFRFFSFLLILSASPFLIAFSDDMVSAGNTSGQDAVFEEVDGVVIFDRIQVADGLYREVRENSQSPVAEFLTDEGNYYAFYADGKSGGYFEYLPEGNSPTKGVREARSLAEAYRILAPLGDEVPEMLQDTSEAIRMVELDPSLEIQPDEDWPYESFLSPETQRAAGSLFCGKSQANNFYNSYRPGVWGSEGANAYTPGNQLAKIAKRILRYQKFHQSNYENATPNLTGYLRASTKVCTSPNYVRLYLWYCYNTLNTNIYGCGEAGSNVYLQHGPFVMYQGGSGTYSDSANGDIVRAKVTNVSSSSEQIIWSVFNSSISTNTITNCYR